MRIRVEIHDFTTTRVHEEFDTMNTRHCCAVRAPNFEHIPTLEYGVLLGVDCFALFQALARWLIKTIAGCIGTVRFTASRTIITGSQDVIEIRNQDTPNFATATCCACRCDHCHHHQAFVMCYSHGLKPEQREYHKIHRKHEKANERASGENTQGLKKGSHLSCLLLQ